MKNLNIKLNIEIKYLNFEFVTLDRNKFKIIFFYLMNKEILKYLKYNLENQISKKSLKNNFLI